MLSDTIYALSTPIGRSAIAVIRISGKNSFKTLKKISSIKKIYPNKTTLSILKFENKPIDQVVINYFKKPKKALLNLFDGDKPIKVTTNYNL